VARSTRRLTRPYRRLRGWARHPPKATIGLNLIAIGLVLMLAAPIIAGTVLR
jgi:hypothetical protein